MAQFHFELRKGLRRIQRRALLARWRFGRVNVPTTNMEGKLGVSYSTIHLHLLPPIQCRPLSPRAPATLHLEYCCNLTKQMLHNTTGHDGGMVASLLGPRKGAMDVRVSDMSYFLSLHGRRSGIIRQNFGPTPRHNTARSSVVHATKNQDLLQPQ